MFTGIVESTAKILEKNNGGITVSRPIKFTELQIGQSIAVNGACLSVTKAHEESISFDVVPETFAKTNLGTAETVNLERAMTADGRFEGHVVLGHVDGTAKILSRIREGAGERMRFEIPVNLAPYLVPKGSITLNGISLTIAAVENDQFEVAVIPQTLQKTNLAQLNVGDDGNIEADYFAKLLYRWHSLQI